MPPSYPTIADATNGCRESFEKCTTIPSLMEGEWAANRLADLNLWSYRARTCAEGQASLHSKLESEPKFRNVIIDSLSMLVSLLEKCYEDARHMAKLAKTSTQDSNEASSAGQLSSNVPSPSTDDDTAIERVDLKENINDVEVILKDLIRLTTVIKNTGITSRFFKADSQFNPAAHHDLSRELQSILMVETTTELQRPESSQPSQIQWRLIEANLRRRNRFLFQQESSTKLAMKRSGSFPSLKWLTQTIWQILNILALGLFTSPFVRLMIPPPWRVPPSDNLELQHSLPPRPAETSVSEAQDYITEVDWPNPPEIEPGEICFECPYCCQRLNVELARTERWRKHIADDIQPYTCILGNCPEPYRLFESGELWLRHMTTEHSGAQYWRCPAISCSEEYSDEDLFKTHLRETHPRSCSMADMSSLVSECVHYVLIDIRRCPLCPSKAECTDVNASILLEHIAMHLHSFSLKSLPEPRKEDSFSCQRLFEGDNYFLKYTHSDTSSKVERAVRDIDTFPDRSPTGLEALESDHHDEQDSGLHAGDSSDPATDPGAAPEMPHSGVGNSAEARRKAASKLQDELFAALIEQRPGAQCFYIPEDRKGRIITRAAIQEQCRVGVDSCYVKNVHKLSRNLFAILGYIGMAPEICAFIDEGLTDADLPFVYQSATGILTRKNGTEIRSSRDWQRATRFAFVRDQWSILAPIFSDKEHYIFHDNAILPFTHEELLSKDAYSELVEASIHPAHHHWRQGPVQSPLSVAIKKLHFHNEDEFQKERTILITPEAKENNHLVKLLFSYEHKGSYHLVFRRATGNLRNFWELNPHPQFVPDMVLWSLRQMMGITRGLRIIHNFQVTIPLSITETEMETPQGKAKMSVKNGEERYGRHGDLKPENILWFRDSTGDVCQITDFGLGRFHGRDTRTKAAPYTIYSSPTYEPPECHIYLPVSRAYDLWSLGCLFLEWVSWMLNGWQAIDDFSRSRVEQSLIMNQDGIISDDYFWSLILDGNNRNARVRDGVEQWVLKLREHPKCSQLIHDILSLIMQDLLCIVPSRRSNAAALENDLRALVSRAEGDDGYAFDPCPSTSHTQRDSAPKPAPPQLRHDPYQILPRR